MTTSNDPHTIAFYDAEADTYAAKARDVDLPPSFLRLVTALPPGGHVLDLGSGDGHYAHAFEARGFEVTAMDASAGLAAIASKNLRKPVRVARFDELEDVAEFDGVWAHASLHHAPVEALPDAIARIHRSLRPGGIFHMSVKTGKPAGRDRLGRFYSYPSRSTIDHALTHAGAWAETDFQTTHREGYDGVATDWIILFARKA